MTKEQWFDQRMLLGDVRRIDQKMPLSKEQHDQRLLGSDMPIYHQSPVAADLRLSGHNMSVCGDLYFDQMSQSSDVQIFDQMLTITTELFIDIEEELFLRRLDAQKPLSILDVGCGNGEYLARVSRRYPQWRCTGLEMDERIYRYAEGKQSSRLSFHLSYYEQFESLETYDCVIVRLTAAHLEDRAHFMRWLRERTHIGSLILIIDADEDIGQLAGEANGLPLLGALYREMRRPLRASKLMLLHESLALEARYAGLRPGEVVRYGRNADTPESKALIHAYMQLVAASRFGMPLPPEYGKELKRWYEEPQAAFEIRIFGLMLEV